MSNTQRYAESAGTPKRDHELELESFTTIVRLLQALSAEARQRVLEAVGTLMGIGSSTRESPRGVFPSAVSVGPAETPRPADFGGDRTPSPKDFLFDKKPRTDVERVACLAYYLTHYRATPHFKTLELSKLNMKAAQLKFSNAAYAVDNATKAGFLVPASNGAKQLSAVGELYVQALPDRSAAHNVVANARPRKRNRRAKRSVTESQNESSAND